MSGGSRQVDSGLDFCGGVADLCANLDAPVLPGSEASPPTSCCMGGPALGGGPCVGEGRGAGTGGAGAEFQHSRSATRDFKLVAPSHLIAETPPLSPSPTCACVEGGMGQEVEAARGGGGAGGGAGERSADARLADAEFQLDTPNSVTPPSSPSPTYTCVEEGVGEEARMVRAGARAGERSGDVGSTDAGFADATSKGTRGGRLASHKQAGPSPRCAWGWVEQQLERKKALYLGCIGQTEALFVTWRVTLQRSTVCHVVGRGGRTLQRIEDFCGAFLALRDIGEEQSELLLWGSPEGVALADFVVLALDKGMHSILRSLGRLGF